MKYISTTAQKILAALLCAGLAFPSSALAEALSGPHTALRNQAPALPSANYSLNVSASGLSPASLASPAGLSFIETAYPALHPGLNIVPQQAATVGVSENKPSEIQASISASSERRQPDASTARAAQAPQSRASASPTSRALLSQLKAKPEEASAAFDGYGRMGLLPGNLKLPEGVSLDPLPQAPEISGVPSSAWRRQHRTQPSSLLERFILGPLGLAEQPAFLPGSPQDAQGVEDALLDWVRAHPDQFENIAPGSLRALSAHKAPGLAGRPDMVYVSFQQTLDGVPVEGSWLNFSVKLINGRAVIASSQAQLYPDLDVKNVAHLKEEEVLARVAQRLKITPDEAKLLRMGRRVMNIEGQWRLIDFFRGPNGLLGAVDLQNGSSFVWDTRAKLVEGTARGRGVLFDPQKTGNDLNPLPLGYLELETSQGKKFYSDAEGNFTVEGRGSGPVTVTARLKGKYAEIHNNAGKDLEVTVSARPGQKMRVIFNPAGHEEHDVAQVNAYHHATQTHEYLKSQGVAHAGIEKAIDTKVNEDDECNAFYDYKSLNFFRASEKCINTAFDTVISHEYGHFWHMTATNRIGEMDLILHSMLRRMSRGGVSEGWGDIVAMFRTGQQLVGEGFFQKKDDGNDIRTGENDYQYTPGGEVHEEGQAWMGFAWKLRRALIRSLGEAEGAALASALVLPVVFTGVDEIPELVHQVLLRDTNENGAAPHFDLIEQAAQAHGIKVTAPSPKRRQGDGLSLFGFRIPGLS